MGEILLYQGQVDDALTELRRAVELAPQDPGNHAALAKALSAKGLTAEAEEEMRKAQPGAVAVISICTENSLKHVLQLLTLCCSRRSCSRAGRPPRRPVVRPPNVILITIDTVRADHLGCYGATDVKTPTLDALARDGVVFERAISQVPLTWPSHAAILTGTYPFQNGVQDFTGQPLDPRFRSVAQVFKQQGYATGAVVSAFVLDRSWGLSRGFDFYDDAFSAETFRQKDIGLVDRRAGDSITHAISWLQKPTRRPFFFWLHLYDPHSPYDPPEPFRTQYRSHPYDGEIAYADHELGRLVAWLKQNRLYDRTAIVVLSDHGESLGEHGEKEHGFFVYNSTIHIPLIVKPPAGSRIRPGRVAAPVETVAVAPTLTRLAGMKDEIQKQFPHPGLLEDKSEDAAYSESFYAFSSFGWSPLHALQTTRYHYIQAPTRELYDVVADPQEKNNLAPQQTATVAVLDDKLQSLLRQNPFKPGEPGTSGLSPDALEKLQALGYVAYRSPVSARGAGGRPARSQEQVVGVQCHPGGSRRLSGWRRRSRQERCWRRSARAIRRCMSSLSCWERMRCAGRPGTRPRPSCKSVWS